MKNLIEILPNIYGVKVPIEEVKYLNIKFDFNGNHMLESVDDTFKLKIPFDFKILGHITETEISFDASDVVESTEIDVEQYDGILMAIPRFWDYELESFSCSNSDESFRSALAKEIYFKNPFEEPKGTDVATSSFFEMQTDYQLEKKWQTANQNITEKLLILHKL